MKPTHSPVLLALLSLGCTAQTIDGVWQFSQQATDDGDDTCTESISHNFTYGWVPSDGDEDAEPGGDDDGG